jgi:predicted HicB family RNase H-like nuclease
MKNIPYNVHALQITFDAIKETYSKQIQGINNAIDDAASKRKFSASITFSLQDFPNEEDVVGLMKYISFFGYHVECLKEFKECIEVYRIVINWSNINNLTIADYTRF